MEFIFNCCIHSPIGIARQRLAEQRGLIPSDGQTYYEVTQRRIGQRRDATRAPIWVREA